MLLHTESSYLQIIRDLKGMVRDAAYSNRSLLTFRRNAEPLSSEVYLGAVNITIN